MNTTQSNGTIDTYKISDNVSVAAPASVENTEHSAEGDVEGLEARTKIVREQFDMSMEVERKAADTAEENQASLLALGYENGLDWLANRSVLRTRLTAIGISPASDDYGLLSQIAKLQLGRWTATKDGGHVWKVPSRRDERLGRFYRIFYGQPERFPRDRLKQVILTYPKRSGGILADASPKAKPLSKDALAANREKAKSIKRAKVVTPERIGTVGSYKLVLARVTDDGFDLVQVIEDEALTNRVTDKWAADAATSVE